MPVEVHSSITIRLWPLDIVGKELEYDGLQYLSVLRPFPSSSSIFSLVQLRPRLRGLRLDDPTMRLNKSHSLYFTKPTNKLHVSAFARAPYANRLSVFPTPAVIKTLEHAERRLLKFVTITLVSDLHKGLAELRRELPSSKSDEGAEKRVGGRRYCSKYDSDITEEQRKVTKNHPGLVHALFLAYKFLHDIELAQSESYSYSYDHQAKAFLETRRNNQKFGCESGCSELGESTLKEHKDESESRRVQTLILNKLTNITSFNSKTISDQLSNHATHEKPRSLHTMEPTEASSVLPTFKGRFLSIKPPGEKVAVMDDDEWLGFDLGGLKFDGVEINHAAGAFASSNEAAKYVKLQDKRERVDTEGDEIDDREHSKISSDDSETEQVNRISRLSKIRTVEQSQHSSHIQSEDGLEDQLSARGQIVAYDHDKYDSEADGSSEISIYDGDDIYDGDESESCSEEEMMIDAYDEGEVVDTDIGEGAEGAEMWSFDEGEEVVEVGSGGLADSLHESTSGISIRLELQLDERTSRWRARVL
ncbi:hypothetical protein SCHPADRAFT_895572 [Schizopora paradoxa]|uniref:Uncharacterized protein n=1 Tax=Schizopora paradoxa TaxID=27342 RepID=A0A0H2R4M3_9AGAM|nr:hypothetical protein SCHPADRAFT_895572 [Schizopora paradoxa]